MDPIDPIERVELQRITVPLNGMAINVLHEGIEKYYEIFGRLNPTGLLLGRNVYFELWHMSECDPSGYAPLNETRKHGLLGYINRYFFNQNEGVESIHLDGRLDLNEVYLIQPYMEEACRYEPGKEPRRVKPKPVPPPNNMWTRLK